MAISLWFVNLWTSPREKKSILDNCVAVWSINNQQDHDLVLKNFMQLFCKQLDRLVSFWHAMNAKQKTNKLETQPNKSQCILLVFRFVGCTVLSKCFF